MTKLIPLLAFAAATSVHAGDKQTPAPDLSKLDGKEAEAFFLGSNAIIWAYPAILFEDLMQGRTLPGIVEKGNPQTAVNQLGHVRNLRGPEYKQIATPNNDTLYSQAFCDISREPLVITVPAVPGDRYYGIQLWDPNGDTFNYIGSRSTGREPGSYAICGPSWKGTLPDGAKRIDSPYNGFVFWCRTGVDGPSDLENARAVQDGLRLTPLSQFGKSSKSVAPDLEFSKQRVAIEIPADLPEGLELYYKLARTLKFTPAKPEQDAVVFASLTEIGFTDHGTTFDYESLSPAQISGLAKGAQFAIHLMDINAQTTGLMVNGWRWSPKSGVMGTDYLFRAAFAKWFTGGNAPEEAIYMDARRDDQGEVFSGTKNYTLHFEKGKTPPVAAFWSLSMYNLADGSFVENPIKRYSIGDRTPGLTENPDGSLTLYLQHTAPTDPNAKANWLPSPKEGFYLDLRLYVPDESLAKGTWAPPAVTLSK